MAIGDGYVGYFIVGGHFLDCYLHFLLEGFGFVGDAM